MPTELNGNGIILSHFFSGLQSFLKIIFIPYDKKANKKEKQKLTSELGGHKKKCNLHIFAFTIVLNKLEQQMNINDNVQ